MEKILTNPLAAAQSVSDYTTYVDADGLPINYDQEVETVRANAAVAAGDVVRFVAATTTVPLSVTPVELDATVVNAQAIYGVAVSAAAAGSLCQVITKGPALVNIATTAAISSNVAGTAATPAFGVLAVPAGAGTNNAPGNCHGLTPSASTIVGASFGVFLGAEIGTSNKAPVYVGKSV